MICPPLGQEYIRSHRTCRILASRLAEKGQDVLRFDYYGTGDSGGDAEELSVSGAIEDTLAGIEEIKDVAQVRRVTLVGLRAGALIAAHAARASPAVDRLVLWDPVTDGKAYAVDEILSGTPVGSSGDVETRGFVFSKTIQRELAQASLTALDRFPANVLILVREDSDEFRQLETHVRTAGAAVDFEYAESPPSWTEMADLGVGALPAEALRCMAAW